MVETLVAILSPIVTFLLGMLMGATMMHDKMKRFLVSKQEQNKYYETMRSPEVMVEAQLAARRIREARDNGRKTMPRETAGPPAIINRNAFRRAKRRRYGPPPGLK